jgi:hypothetical protein
MLRVFFKGGLGYAEFFHTLFDAIVYSRMNTLMHGHGKHNVCFQFYVFMCFVCPVFLCCFGFVSPLCIAVSALFLYKFTNRWHRVETLLQ